MHVPPILKRHTLALTAVWLNTTRAVINTANNKVVEILFGMFSSLYAFDVKNGLHHFTDMLASVLHNRFICSNLMEAPA
jgi:hypothetical protein